MLVSITTSTTALQNNQSFVKNSNRSSETLQTSINLIIPPSPCVWLKSLPFIISHISVSLSLPLLLPPPRPRPPEAPLWPKEVLEPVVVTEGTPLVLACNPPPGLPPPFTFWMNSGEQQLHTSIHLYTNIPGVDLGPFYIPYTSNITLFKYIVPN